LLQQNETERYRYEYHLDQNAINLQLLQVECYTNCYYQHFVSLWCTSSLLTLFSCCTHSTETPTFWYRWSSHTTFDDDYSIM